MPIHNVISRVVSTTANEYGWARPFSFCVLLWARKNIKENNLVSVSVYYQELSCFINYPFINFFMVYVHLSDFSDFLTTQQQLMFSSLYNIINHLWMSIFFIFLFFVPYCSIIYIILLHFFLLPWYYRHSLNICPVGFHNRWPEKSALTKKTLFFFCSKLALFLNVFLHSAPL